MAIFDQYEPNRMCWLDLNSTNTEASRQFYGQLFGWVPEADPDPAMGGYQNMLLNGKRVCGLAPTMSPEQRDSWNMYVCTDDAAKSLEVAEQNGATVIVPAAEVSEKGTFGGFADPGGSFVGVWQPKSHKGAQIGNEAGAWMASELNSSNVGQVTDFYKQVFNWEVSPWEGTDGYYTIMLNDFVAGVMRDQPASLGNTSATWVNYFVCSDLDATTHDIERLGGQPVGNIEQIPIARKALYRDPQGALFGMFEMRG